MQIGGISQQTKLLAGYFFLHVDMATHFVYARSPLLLYGPPKRSRP
jgi:hypothetical protein